MSGHRRAGVIGLPAIVLIKVPLTGCRGAAADMTGSCKNYSQYSNNEYHN